MSTVMPPWAAPAVRRHRWRRGDKLMVIGKPSETAGRKAMGTKAFSQGCIIMLCQPGCWYDGNPVERPVTQSHGA